MVFTGNLFLFGCPSLV